MVAPFSRVGRGRRVLRTARAQMRQRLPDIEQFPHPGAEIDPDAGHCLAFAEARDRARRRTSQERPWLPGQPARCFAGRAGHDTGRLAPPPPPGSIVTCPAPGTAATAGRRTTAHSPARHRLLAAVRLASPDRRFLQSRDQPLRRLCQLTMIRRVASRRAVTWYQATLPARGRVLVQGRKAQDHGRSSPSANLTTYS